MSNKNVKKNKNISNSFNNNVGSNRISSSYNQEKNARGKRCTEDGCSWLNESTKDIYANALMIDVDAKGRMSIWNQEDRMHLKFYVTETDRNNFQNVLKSLTFQEFMKTFKDAYSAWNDVCGVKFSVVEGLPNGNRGINIPIIFVEELDCAYGDILARSFFPHDLPENRKLIITKHFESDPERYPMLGGLMHELGHILGFRHEHVFGCHNSSDNENQGNAKLILGKDKDINSIMHYPGVTPDANTTLAQSLSSIDAASAACIYPL